MSDRPAEPTRWGFWRPIGCPRVDEFVSAGAGGCSMRRGDRGAEEVAHDAALAEVWRTRIRSYVEDVSEARGLREPVITEAEAMAAMVGKSSRAALAAFQGIVDGRLAVAAYWWPWSEGWCGQWGMTVGEIACDQARAAIRARGEPCSTAG